MRSPRVIGSRKLTPTLEYILGTKLKEVKSTHWSLGVQEGNLKQECYNLHPHLNPEVNSLIGEQLGYHILVPIRGYKRMFKYLLATPPPLLKLYKVTCIFI